MESVHSEFRVAFPRNVFFGRGSIKELPRLIGSCQSRRVAVVSGSGSAAADVVRVLAVSGHAVGHFVRHGEPTVDVLETLVEEISGFEPDIVIGVGGGSAIDAAKVVAAMIPNRGRPLRDRLPLDGDALPLDRQPLRMLAVPTTAGTGAEATSNAVVAVGGRKVSMRDPLMIPEAAIVDADLGEEVPFDARVAAAFDATVQLIEAFVTPLGNPVTVSLAYTGAEIACRVLPRIVSGSESAADRQEMATAATLSGVALANSKLGTVHGFAGVVGGRIGIAHGALCGVFAEPVINATVTTLRNTEPDHPVLERYRTLAQLCVGGRRAEAEDLAEWFGRWVREADLPRPALPGSSFAEIADLVVRASSTSGNPVEVPVDGLTRILKTVAIEDEEDR